MQTSNQSSEPLNATLAIFVKIFIQEDRNAFHHDPAAVAGLLQECKTCCEEGESGLKVFEKAILEVCKHRLR